MKSAKAHPIPELIAPAGDWDCVRAAVENGADAIYFGLDRHNARMRATNFTLAELPRLMEFLHLRGLRGYVTFNTLVFPEEMDEAEEWLRALISAGADAAIIQDVGICRLIRSISPDFPIHASTQMTITSAAGIEFARELGCASVTLARECSIHEIESIHMEFGQGPDSRTALPLEIFVHGALCVAYSGQCLTSESLGGRSANRGVCAQACRMSYDLIADGRPVTLGDRRYLLSPRDLSGLDLLPELIRAGVASLKIEGRLKSPEYVANITGIYREALDLIAKDLAGNPAESGRSGSDFPDDLRAKIEADILDFSRKHRYDMEMAFSRGLYTGWLRGTNNRELVHGRFGKKRGVFLGRVTRRQGAAIYLKLQAPLKPGDGIVFDAGRPENEEGGRIYSCTKEGEETRLEFGTGDLDLNRVRIGDRVWKTNDPDLDRRLRKTYAGDQPRYRRPIRMTISGRSSQPMVLEVQDQERTRIRIESVISLTKAEKQPLTSERLREQLGRLGGTPFRLGELENHLEGAVILPLSELNRMRRQTVDELSTARTRPRPWTVVERTAVGHASSETLHQRVDVDAAELIVLVRSMAQLEAALANGANTIYCEFEDPKQYHEAVTLGHSGAAGGLGSRSPRDTSASIWVAPPRISKPGEDWILRLVRSCGADGYLVRNYDHLKYFSGCRTVGDYTFNITNALSAEYFIQRYSLERVTASYDLDVAQLESLLRTAPSSWFEITIHQHMPMFHMEHCLFCAFLSEGMDYTNCGRPCDVRELKLRDRMGDNHGVKADAGCRNTIFNALAQTGAGSADRLMELGVRHFRLEFLDESPELLVQTISSYRRLLRREITGTQLWQELKILNQIGV